MTVEAENAPTGGQPEPSHTPAEPSREETWERLLAEVASLPSLPGVYRFLDARGQVLYVGKATNLRSRVRSYFSTDERRKIGSLLRETARIDHKVCPSTLEASVLEARLIRALEPRFNSHGTRWRRYPYLKLTLDEPFPRLSVVRAIRDDGALYLGPLPSAKSAKRVAEAIETAVPLRRCTATPGRGGLRSGPCAPAQLGVATCPCAGSITPDAYAELVATVRRGLLHEPALLLGPLEAKMHALAAEERFEEAADMRDRAAALAQALRRQERFDALRRAGRVVMEVDGSSRAELLRGRLQRTWTITKHGIAAVPLPLDLDPAAPDALEAPDPGDPSAPGAPLPKALADELACVAQWIDRYHHRIRVLHADGSLIPTGPPLPSFEPPVPFRR